MYFDVTRDAPDRAVGMLVDAGEELAVYSRYCTNPACTCEEVTVVAAELDGDGLGAERATLKVGRQGARAGSGSAEIVDALRALPRWVADDALEEKRERHLDHVHREGFRLSRAQLESRDPVYWLDYASHRGSLLSGRDGDAYIRVNLDDDEWAVDVSICPRPGCDCRRVLLRYMRIEVRDEVLHAREAPPLPLDLDGSPRWSEFDGDRVLATRIWRAWSDEGPDPADVLPGYYRTIKDLGLQVRKPAPRARRPSKNAPCPCGSGRKYKACCG